MTTLHVPTIYALTVAIMLLHMVMLTFAWVQNRNVRALLCWGLGNGGMGIALALLFLRGSIPQFLSIDVAYALLIMACGLILRGSHDFAGIRSSNVVIFGGAVLWLITCQIPQLYGSVTARTVIVSGILSFYVGAAAYSFYRSREERLLSRWPLIILMAFNSVLFAARIPLAILYPLAPGAATSVDALQSPWFAAASAAVLFFNTAMNFLFLSMVKERAELVQKRSADTDPLTGLLNRRAFLENAERIAASGHVSLAMIDLDRFKQINDRFGHEIGDETLRLFARMVREEVGERAVVGRMGGEEFAIVAQSAGEKLRIIVERLSQRFTDEGKSIQGAATGATFSAGIANASGAPVSDLLRFADKALYIAKSSGRNRVLRYEPHIGEPANSSVNKPKGRSPLAA